MVSYDTIGNLNNRKLREFTFKDRKFNTNNALKTFSNFFGPFSTIICDEGHRLKGGDGILVYKALQSITAK